MRFVDRHDTFLHLLYFFCIDVHTDNGVAGFGKAGACYQSNVSGSYYGYLHFVNSKTESVMCFNVSLSNSVCIGKEITEAHSLSVTGYFFPSLALCVYAGCECSGTG